MVKNMCFLESEEVHGEIVNEGGIHENEKKSETLNSKYA
jgi:hypothetical protein